MSKYLEIDSFFGAYQDWKNDLFPNTQTSFGSAISEVDEFISQDFFASKDKTMHKEIESLCEEHNLPDYYKVFLLAYTYRNLELPLFSFPSTHPVDKLALIKQDIERFIQFELVPFACDKHGYGLYCIDMQQDEGIVFYENHQSPQVQRNIPVLACSFLSLLAFLKEYLDWGGNISGLDEEDKEEAVSELKALDPKVGATWEHWWLPKMI